MSQTDMRSNEFRNTGFTLLEIMVALVIFSVGLLGLAGLQASGMRSNKTADLRSMAIIEAHDMAERIRINDAGVRTGDYDSISTGIPTMPGTDCYTSNCNNSDISAWDIFEWQSQLADALPSGRGTVDRASSTAPFRITVMWDEAGTGVTGEGCSGDPTTDLKCYSLDFLP
jgi:type IV pilus assembly protein PilV